MPTKVAHAASCSGVRHAGKKQASVLPQPNPDPTASHEQKKEGKQLPQLCGDWLETSESCEVRGEL